MVKPGVLLRDLQSFAKKELGEKFIHNLGHGLGIEIHEPPFFRNKEKVQTRQVFTIEPGLYEANKYGIRIEDDILVGEKGVEVLSKKLGKEMRVY